VLFDDARNCGIYYNHYVIIVIIPCDVNWSEACQGAGLTDKLKIISPFILIQCLVLPQAPERHTGNIDHDLENTEQAAIFLFGAFFLMLQICSFTSRYCGSLKLESNRLRPADGICSFSFLANVVAQRSLRGYAGAA
jgi:hypothetical protein